MTTAEAPVATEQIVTTGGQQPATPGSDDLSTYTQCASYKEAKPLAASRRRDGVHAYACYVVALDRWCIR